MEIIIKELELAHDFFNNLPSDNFNLIDAAIYRINYYEKLLDEFTAHEGRIGDQYENRKNIIRARHRAGQTEQGKEGLCGGHEEPCTELN